MLRGLRLRLTLLYLLAALALIALVGVGTYVLVDRYFQSTTDHALQPKMVTELRQLGAPIPAYLADADRTYVEDHTSVFPATPTPPRDEHKDDNHDGDDDHRAGAAPTPRSDIEADDQYNSELVAIIVLPLDSAGQVVVSANAIPPPLPADPAAAQAALATGNDWRTVRLSNGTRVRLLTQRLPGGGAAALLQLGRPLADQDQVLSRLEMGLFSLGALSAVLLGIGSWALAGRALRPAQAAWARQQAFVANASHELRAPLTLLRASAEVAQRGLAPGNTDQRALLDDVMQEADYMSRLVEDLLLLSRLDAGRLQLEREAIALPAILADVQRQVGRLAAEQGVEVVVDSADGTVQADPTRLRQVLLILLDNALRHTPAGGSIRLTAGPQGHAMQIGVADTGSGIAPEHLAHVFERFYQAHQARGGAGDGTGLGLAIARALIAAQHGRIAISSRPGQGTYVTLILPAATPRAVTTRTEDGGLR
jgi:signal transduction histidine kinase